MTASIGLIRSAGCGPGRHSPAPSARGMPATHSDGRGRAAARGRVVTACADLRVGLPELLGGFSPDRTAHQALASVRLAQELRGSYQHLALWHMLPKLGATMEGSATAPVGSLAAVEAVAAESACCPLPRKGQILG